VELKKGKEKKTAGRDQHRIYLFGVNRGRLEHMAREMNLDLEIVDKVEEANLLVTSKNYYRRKPQKVRDAEAANLPIYVLKSNTPPQIRQMLQSIYPVAGPGKRDSFQVALAEAEEAVAKIKNGSEGEVELSPQSAYIRRLQHLIAERNEMASRSEGKDPNRRVKIYKA